MTNDLMRLSDRWALELRDEPETGMGYQIATVILKDGRRLPNTAIIDCTYIGAVDCTRGPPFSESDIASIIVDHGEAHTISFHTRRAARRYADWFRHVVFGRVCDGERPWDAGMRHIMAFVVAPFTAPVILAVYFVIVGMPPETNVMLGASVFAAYSGGILFGVPIYLLLRARQWTMFWIAPVVGFVVGAIMWYATPMLAAMAFGHGATFALTELSRPDTLLNILRFAALPGAAVGAVLWLIGRPDRRRQIKLGEAA